MYAVALIIGYVCWFALNSKPCLPLKLDCSGTGGFSMKREALVSSVHAFGVRQQLLMLLLCLFCILHGTPI